MTLWIDGDSCPKEIREIVYKAAIRCNIELNYIANSYYRIPQHKLFSLVIVDKSLDAADRHIIEHLKEKDVVITSDIPLAYEAVKKNAFVLSSKGETFTEENIREKLATRNLLQELRSSGAVSSYNKPLQAKDINLFANALDRALSKSKA